MGSMDLTGRKPQQVYWKPGFENFWIQTPVLRSLRTRLGTRCYQSIIDKSRKHSICSPVQIRKVKSGSLFFKLENEFAYLPRGQVSWLGSKLPSPLGSSRVAIGPSCLLPWAYFRDMMGAGGCDCCSNMDLPFFLHTKHQGTWDERRMELSVLQGVCTWKKK